MFAAPPLARSCIPEPELEPGRFVLVESVVGPRLQREGEYSTQKVRQPRYKQRRPSETTLRSTLFLTTENSSPPKHLEMGRSLLQKILGLITQRYHGEPRH